MCRNRARAAGRRPQLAADVSVDPASTERSPDDAAEAGETAAALAAALWRIPETQRRAVVLHHAGGLTYVEVAAAMGRAEGSVKADVHRGIAALRTLLEPQEVLS